MDSDVNRACVEPQAVFSQASSQGGEADECLAAATVLSLKAEAQSLLNLGGGRLKESPPWLNLLCSCTVKAVVESTISTAGCWQAPCSSPAMLFIRLFLVVTGLLDLGQPCLAPRDKEMARD